jgi:hypothetical protein
MALLDSRHQSNGKGRYEHSAHYQCDNPSESIACDASWWKRSGKVLDTMSVQQARKKEGTTQCMNPNRTIAEQRYDQQANKQSGDIFSRIAMRSYGPLQSRIVAMTGANIQIDPNLGDTQSEYPDQKQAQTYPKACCSEWF